MSRIRKPDRSHFKERAAVSGLREAAEDVIEATEAPRRGVWMSTQVMVLAFIAPLVIAGGLAGVGRPAGLGSGTLFALGGILLPLALFVPIIRADARRRRERIARIREWTLDR